MSQKSTTFMPISVTPFYLSTTFGHSFRSHSFHHIVKHCVEGSYLSGPSTYHIGFTPYQNERNFVSFLRYTTNNIYLYQRTDSNTDKTHKIEPNVFKQNETFLVCLESEARSISVVFGNETIETQYDIFDKIEEWYVFFDTSGLGTSPVHVMFNLGFTKFNNTIPEGFFPWNYDINGLRGIKKHHITISCRSHTLHITYIYLIINSH